MNNRVILTIDKNWPLTLYKQSIYLALAGTLLFVVGSVIAIWPEEYLSQFHVTLGVARLDFLNELRGMGGTLFIFSLYILWSLIQKKFQDTALVISSLIFSSFVIFRLFGMVLDGTPGQGILVALFIEFVFSIAAIGLIINGNTGLSAKN